MAMTYEKDKQSDLFGGTNPIEIKTLLKTKFLIPPFSVFDTKQGQWQDRKRKWLNLTGNLEDSREGTLFKSVATQSEVMKKKITKAKLKAREKRLNKREFKSKIESWKQEIISRDKNTCQMCGKDMANFPKHCHHIISFQSVKRNYSFLLEDINNGILLCGYCHKFAPNSPHQGGFEFSLYIMKNKPLQISSLLKRLGGDFKGSNYPITAPR